MRETWTTWLLAGALVASLQWNLRGGESAPASECGAAEEGTSCSLDPDGLGLSGSQASELLEVCESSCALADDLTRQSAERVAELREALASEDIDEAQVGRLVDGISELRTRSLRACVDSILGARRVLEPDQLRTLLDTCYRVTPAAGDSDPAQGLSISRNAACASPVGEACGDDSPSCNLNQ